MKNIFSIIVVVGLFLSFKLDAQNYNISQYNNQTVTTCSGNFYDSGGPTGGYSASQVYTITFCPSTPGAYIHLNFSQWTVSAGDAMEVFDGSNASAPSFGVFNTGMSPVGMVVGASILNPSGCLTLRWTSVSAGQGWAATVSCGLPCQNFYTTLVSSIPPFHVDSGIFYIDVCPHDTITLVGGNTYPKNDSVYHQSDLTSIFVWDLGNGQIDTGQTVQVIYDTIQGYNIELNSWDTNSCMASTFPKIRVRVSTKPTFNGTHPLYYNVCQGDTNQLIGAVQTKKWKANPSLGHAGTTFLPDGSGASYTSTLVFNSFAVGQVLTNPSNLVSVCANMEHSYLGDLNLTLTCPNGTSVTLKSYSGGGGGTFLGEPIDDQNNLNPGVGYDYCWKNTGTITMSAAAGIYNHSFTDLAGTFYSNASYLPPSTSYPAASTASLPYPTLTYTPVTPFSSLVGCPLNGAWTITVTDNLLIDNGYIFSWQMEFAQNILPVSWSYQPVITSHAWNPNANIVGTNGSTVNIVSPDTGAFTYVYTVVDNLGCSYDTSVTINVTPRPTVDLGNDLVLCGQQAILLDATSNIPGVNYVWNAPFGPFTPTLSINTPGTWSGSWNVTVSSASGSLQCSDSDTINISQFQPAVVDLGIDTCVNIPFTLNAGNVGGQTTYNFLWNDGSTSNTLFANSTGLYTVTVSPTNLVPCDAVDDIYVKVYEPGFLGTDLEFCDFDTKTVQAPTGFTGHENSFLWQFGNISTPTLSSNYLLEGLLPGNYSLQVTIDGTCTDFIDIKINNCELTLPNVITPNGDGFNDYFVIKGLEFFDNTILKIYNRWGMRVYESDNYRNDWNGTDVSDGVYFFYLELTQGRQEVYKGTVTVMRH